MTDTPTDDRLLTELQDALQAADPVPADVLATAKASFTWRTVDAELAALAFDSALDETAGVRSEDDARHLVFRSGDLEVEVMVAGTAPRSLTGQLVPPQPAVVELRTGEHVIASVAGPDGAFAFPTVPGGPVSLRCILEEGTKTVTTEWLHL